MTCLKTLAILAPAKFENAGPGFDHDDFLEAGVGFMFLSFWLSLLLEVYRLLLCTPTFGAILLQFIY